MAPRRKKAKVVTEPSRERERGRSAMRGTYKDLKGDASTAPARRQSSRIAAKRTQGHQTRNLQPTDHPGRRAKSTTKSKQAATRTKLPGIQGKSSIQPRKTRENLSSGDPVTAPGIDFGKRVRGRGRPKKAAGPIEQTQQDSELGSQRRLDPIPIGFSLSAAFSGESSDSELQKPTTALTWQALEKHTRDTAQVSIIDQIRIIKRISGLLLAENSIGAQSADTVVVDRQDEFNYKWGYLPPLGEEAACVLTAIIQDPTVANIMVRLGPDSGKFRHGLENDRNVNLKPSSDSDPRSNEINALNLDDFFPETPDQQRCHDELWRFDKVKCAENSSEALFQRTLMISLIARHTLVYQQGTGKTQVLDFNVEEPWQCPPMPTKAAWRASEERAFNVNFLTQPKPDLALCFNRESVIPHHIWSSLLAPTRALACFENMNSGASRIFHFLTVEAIKAMINIDSDRAKYQSLNNASQALHNMYEFFSDAGSDHKKTFFDKVRFFSVVANSKGMLVRIHRAVEIPEAANPGYLILPDQPKYRLKFEYEEFAKIETDNEYSRERVFDIFRRILKYAVEDLGELIKAAALALSTTMRDDPAAYVARRDEAFYRHGQPRPLPATTNLDGNIVTSKLTHIKQQLLEATLNTNHTRIGGDTERPPEAEPLSLQSHRAQKRSRNDRDAGLTNDENPQEANKRPKRARGHNPQ